MPPEAVTKKGKQHLGKMQREKRKWSVFARNICQTYFLFVPQVRKNYYSS